MRKMKQQSLQQSKDYVMSQAREFVSKDERQFNLMKEYEYEEKADKLDYKSFYWS